MQFRCVLSESCTGEAFRPFLFLVPKARLQLIRFDRRFFAELPAQELDVAGSSVRGPVFQLGGGSQGNSIACLRGASFCDYPHFCEELELQKNTIRPWLLSPISWNRYRISSTCLLVGS